MKDLDKPFISIIIPSYNQGKFIENCILSVLGQDFQNWELIIQDGESSDDTPEICNRYAFLDNRVKFFCESDSGFADAVNKALHKCRGEIIGIQSSDDFYASGHVFSEVSKIYSNHSYLNIISGKALSVNHELRSIVMPQPFLETGFLEADTVFTLKNHFSQSATFFSLSRAKYIGGLDNDLDMVADTDFWIRMATYSPVSQNAIYRTSQVWGCVTIHPDQRSSELSNFFVGRARMSLKHLSNEKIDLGYQVKYNHAYALIEGGIKYFEHFDLDCSFLDGLYFKLLSHSLPLTKRIKRYFKSLPLLKKYFHIIPLNLELSC
ncbi:MAG: glycosyltransferase [Cyanobacteria bacterium P01_D01_bin.156]